MNAGQTVHRRGEKRFWRVALIVPPLAFVVAATIWFPLWRTIGVPAAKPFFMDLGAVLAAGQAWVNGLDVYQPNPFDPLNRPHVYGAWWLWIGLTGLTVADATWLGWVLALGFLGLAATLLAPRSASDFGRTVLLLFSPPVLFALERGNNDLIIVGLLVAFAGLLSRPEKACRALSCAVFILASALKIYPLAAVIALMSTGRGKRWMLLVAGVLTVTAGVGVVWWADYQRMLRVMPAPDTLHGYGLKVIGFAWKAYLTHGNGYIFALALGGAAVGLLLAKRGGLLNVGALWSAVPISGFHSLVHVVGAAAWGFCFCFNSNYTYRAVLLLLPAALWAKQSSDNAAPPDVVRTARLQLWLWTAVLWAAAPKLMLTTLLHQSQDVILKIALTAVVALEQTLSLALTAILAVCVTGWMFRQWRRDDQPVTKSASSSSG